MQNGNLQMLPAQLGFDEYDSNEAAADHTSYTARPPGLTQFRISF